MINIAKDKTERIKEIGLKPYTKNSVSYWRRRLANPHFQEDVAREILGNPGVPAAVGIGIIVYLVYENAARLLTIFTNWFSILGGVKELGEKAVRDTEFMLNGDAKRKMEEYKDADKESYDKAWTELEKENPVGAKLLRLYEGYYPF